MRYLGGKSKTRKHISVFLESIREPGQHYFEPFVGGGWVMQEMSGERTASDGNIALIALYRAMQLGWQPPEFVSEDEWRAYREASMSADPMMAFARIGCGFGGDWNGGYARSEGKTCYAATSSRSLLNQLPMIRDVVFIDGDYRTHSPVGSLVYCDPPYSNTTAYGAFDGFDHDEFWQTMREWSKVNTVVVSEYSAPDDFPCVREFASRMGLSSGNEGKRTVRTERLFMHESQSSLALPDWLK